VLGHKRTYFQLLTSQALISITLRLNSRFGVRQGQQSSSELVQSRGSLGKKWAGRRFKEDIEARRDELQFHLRELKAEPQSRPRVDLISILNSCERLSKQLVSLADLAADSEGNVVIRTFRAEARGKRLTAAQTEDFLRVASDSLKLEHWD
jgi:hypothetical protein